MLNFTPDGRISTKTNQHQEYLVDGTSKIKSMIEFLVTTVHDQRRIKKRRLEPRRG